MDDAKFKQEILTAKKIYHSKKKFDIHKFPSLQEKLDLYLLENPKLAKNTFFLRFIEQENNLNVFVLSLFAEKEYKEMLEQLFREYLFEFRFIAYLSKTLYFEAVSFDKMQRNKNKRELLVENLDQDIKWVDCLIENKKTKLEFDEDTFATYISEPLLLKAFNKLTDRQQKILYLAYVQEFKDSDIALSLNISQQAVSKSRNRALYKLRKLMEVKS